MFKGKGKHFHLSANFTKDSITGTSTKTPTTVTNTVEDCKPNKAMTRATDNSNKLPAPIIAAEEQIASGNFSFLQPIHAIKLKFVWDRKKHIKRVSELKMIRE